MLHLQELGFPRINVFPANSASLRETALFAFVITMPYPRLKPSSDYLRLP